MNKHLQQWTNSYYSIQGPVIVNLLDEQLLVFLLLRIMTEPGGM
jgi:hypothetical protein